MGITRPSTARQGASKHADDHEQSSRPCFTTRTQYKAAGGDDDGDGEADASVAGEACSPRSGQEYPDMIRYDMIWLLSNRGVFELVGVYGRNLGTDMCR